MTPRQSADLWNKRLRITEREFKKTMRGLGESAVKFDKERMVEEIYAIPEDVAPVSGKKKWQRTRRLLNGEKFQILNPYTVRIYNLARYALPRHEAGKTGQRRINSLRESHWRDEMVKVFQSIMADALALTVRAILKVP